MHSIDRRPALVLSGLLCASLIAICTLQGSPETDVGHFLLGALVLPGVAALLGRPSAGVRLLRGGATAGGWVLAYRLWVSHNNHPWLAGPETNRCDGPCFGWYTFEFSPPYAMLAVAAALSALLGVAIGWSRDRRG